MRFSDIFQSKFVAVGKQQEQEVLGSGKLPDIDLSRAESKRVKSTSKVRNLKKLFYLCLLNPPKDNIQKTAIVYGKIFYKHYELKQRILDSFHAIGPDRSDFVEALNGEAEDIYRDEEQEIRNRPRAKLPGAKPQARFDLSKEDKKSNSVQPELYSELLVSIIDLSDKDSVKSVELFNWDISKQLRDNLDLHLLRVYSAALVIESADEILKKIGKNVPFQSRIQVPTPKHAAYDFVKQRRKGVNMSRGQRIYQIDLQYCKEYEDGKIIKHSDHTQKDPLNALRKADASL